MHCVQPASPALEKALAGHTEQIVLLVAVQGVDGKEPAAHTVQAAHGAWPVAALKPTPATQDTRTQAAAVAFHAKLVAQPQTDWPVRPSETPFCAAVGQVVQVAAVPEAEYLLLVQLVHTLLAVNEAVRLCPGTHGVLGVQAVALAADQLTPAVQLAQTALDVAVHVEAR